MARPVIALLTDFGTRDHYAGTMKAVILGICPEATLVDITHDIPAARHVDGRARAGGQLQVLSHGHDLPGRRRSGRGVGPARHRGRHRRLPVRGPGQRRADGRAQGNARPACRRAHRAAICPGHREPHVRGARPLCAGGRVAGQGHRSVRAGALGRRDSAASRSRRRRLPRMC